MKINFKKLTFLLILLYVIFALTFISLTSMAIIDDITIHFYSQNILIEFSIIFIILVIISFYSYNLLRRIRLERKLKKLQSERISIKQLMKDTQRDRFEKFKLSASIYNIRMDYYSRRLNEIRSQIPVIKEVLKKIEKKKIKKIKKPKKTKKKSKIITSIVGLMKSSSKKKVKKQKKRKKKLPKLKLKKKKFKKKVSKKKVKKKTSKKRSKKK